MVPIGQIGQKRVLCTARFGESSSIAFRRVPLKSHQDAIRDIGGVTVTATTNCVFVTNATRHARHEGVVWPGVSGFVWMISPACQLW